MAIVSSVNIYSSRIAGARPEHAIHHTFHSLDEPHMQKQRRRSTAELVHNSCERVVSGRREAKYELSADAHVPESCVRTKLLGHSTRLCDVAKLANESLHVRFGLRSARGVVSARFLPFRSGRGSGGAGGPSALARQRSKEAVEENKEELIPILPPSRSPVGSLRCRCIAGCTPSYLCS